MAKKAKKERFRFGPPSLYRPLLEDVEDPTGFGLSREDGGAGGKDGFGLLDEKDNGIIIRTLPEARFIHDAMEAIIEAKALPEEV